MPMTSASLITSPNISVRVTPSARREPINGRRCTTETVIV